MSPPEPATAPTHPPIQLLAQEPLPVENRSPHSGVGPQEVLGLERVEGFPPPPDQPLSSSAHEEPLHAETRHIELDSSLELPLLSAWVGIPPARPGLVVRTELLQRLRAALTLKLTLVISEPGFGKTTLLSAWSHSPDIQPAAVTWLTLEEETCQPARFWWTMVAALERALPDCAHLLTTLRPRVRQGAWKSLLVGLLQALEQVSSPLVLVLDNYHEVKELQLHQGLTYLMDHLPAQVHVVIAGRTVPPLPLHRWRARGELLELRTEHLRFTLEETCELLTAQRGLSLTRAEEKRLHDWSEGWLAGLKLGMLLLLEGMSLETLIGTRMGEHRHFSSYLLEEVLFRQEGEVQRFLLETCILEALNPACCDWVTGSPGSQAMLERLESLHLFLVLEVQAPHRYRYHHLLAEALQKHLRRTDPGRLQTCHRRAARWYERQHLPSRALAHALMGEDFPYLDHLLDQARMNVRYRMTADEPELGPLLQAPLDPLEVASPRLILSVAWAYLNRGQARRAEQWLQHAERTLAGQETAPQQALDVLMLRSYLTRPRQKTTSPLERQQLELLASPELGLRPEALAALARLHLFEGDAAASGRAFRQALEAIGPDEDSTPLATFIIRELVSVLRVSGRVRPAIELLKTVLKQATEPGSGGAPPVLGLHMKMALCRNELHELDAAQWHLQQEVKASEATGSCETLANTWTLQSRIRYALGDSSGALDALEEAARQASAARSQDLMAGVAAHQARLALSLHDWDKVRAWQQWRERRLCDEAGHPVVPSILELEDIVLARALLLEGQPAQALVKIGLLLEPALNGDRMLRVLELWLLSAQAHQQLGAEEQALANLDYALLFAEQQGLLKVFLDEGSALTPLLRRVARSGVSPSRAQFLSHLEAGQTIRQGVPAAPVSRMVEPLKERELQILRALADGLSNEDVALELDLGLNTVKWYLKGIFSKLRASNRTEAVARARLVGVLRG